MQILLHVSCKWKNSTSVFKILIWIELKLCFDPNEKYPCMADVLEVQKNSDFGRHIIAKSDIAVGKIVLIEKSYVSLIVAWKRNRISSLARSAQALCFAVKNVKTIRIMKKFVVRI